MEGENAGGGGGGGGGGGASSCSGAGGMADGMGGGGSSGGVLVSTAALVRICCDARDFTMACTCAARTAVESCEARVPCQAASPSVASIIPALSSMPS